MPITTLNLQDESETVAFGARLAAFISPSTTLFLSGDLGAGKTTFSRGLIQGLGHKGAVKSPTYAIVEPYELESIDVFHFDLYRLYDPEELEFMGIRDYFTPRSLCIIEWPERGHGLLPAADIDIQIKFVDTARTITLTPLSEKGRNIVNNLNHHEVK